MIVESGPDLVAMPIEDRISAVNIVGVILRLCGQLLHPSLLMHRA